MTTFYTLKNGNRILVYDYDKLKIGDNRRKEVMIELIKKENGKEVYDRDFTVHLRKDSRGFYFVFGGESVYIDDYEYMTVEELCQYIQKFKSTSFNLIPWLEDYLLATLMHYSDKIGFVMKLPVADCSFTNKITVYSADKVVDTLCVPYEKGNYNKSNWGYKIEFCAESPSLANIVGHKTFYLYDLCRHITMGNVKVVDKQSYKKEYISYMIARVLIEDAESKKLKNRVKRVFSKINRSTPNEKESMDKLQRVVDYMCYGEDIKKHFQSICG